MHLIEPALMPHQIHGSTRSSETVVPQEEAIERGSLHCPNPGSTHGSNSNDGKKLQHIGGRMQDRCSQPPMIPKN